MVASLRTGLACTQSRSGRQSGSRTSFRLTGAARTTSSTRTSRIESPIRPYGTSGKQPQLIDASSYTSRSAPRSRRTVSARCRSASASSALPRAGHSGNRGGEAAVGECRSRTTKAVPGRCSCAFSPVPTTSNGSSRGSARVSVRRRRICSRPTSSRPLRPARLSLPPTGI